MAKRKKSSKKKSGRGRPKVSRTGKDKEMESASSSDNSQESKSGSTKNTNSHKARHNEQKQEDDPQVYLWTTFVQIKIQFNTAVDFLKILRDKYAYLLNTLQLVDDTACFLCANPDKDFDPIEVPEDLPKKMTGLSPYFPTSSRTSPDKAFTFWSTARLAHDVPWEDIVDHTNYDLSEEGIVLMRKRIQSFKTKTPAYFLFINNQIDPLDFVAQVQEDLAKDYDWTVYNRKPWETTFKQVPRDKNKERDRRAEMLAKTFHVEVAEDDADSLLSALRKWIHDGTANAKFGPFVKLVECLTSQSPRSQVERTVRMNGHGRRFQASVSTIELEGLLNPSGVVGTCNVRDMILNYGMEKNKSGDYKSNRIFLSVTRKWNSNAWPG